MAKLEWSKEDLVALTKEQYNALTIEEKKAVRKAEMSKHID